MHSKVSFVNMFRVSVFAKHKDVSENIINLLPGFSYYICLYIVIRAVKHR